MMETGTIFWKFSQYFVGSDQEQSAGETLFGVLSQLAAQAKPICMC